MRCQPLGIAGWVQRNALQYTDRVDVGIDVMPPAGTWQALDDADLFGTDFGPVE